MIGALVVNVAADTCANYPVNHYGKGLARSREAGGAATDGDEKSAEGRLCYGAVRLMMAWSYLRADYHLLSVVTAVMYVCAENLVLPTWKTCTSHRALGHLEYPPIFAGWRPSLSSG